jgi:hypothetical protein
MTEPPGRRIESRWGRRATLLSILLVALGVRAANLSFDLPELYEEATPMRVAWEMGPWDGSPTRLNPGFFHYPSLLFYLHLAAQRGAFTAGSLLGAYPSREAFADAYERDPSTLVLVGRWISVLFGVGTVYLTFRLGERLGGTATALLAAASMALARDHIRVSRHVLVDAPLTFFVALVLVASVSLVREGGRGRWLAAGA